ncbi:hypothetical protein DMJ13_23860 [halophilic archaeon]|nr:hypothetical protein DMJ13_23860 [halophilic archaeon]
MTATTTTWFGTETDRPGPSVSTQYTLTGSYSMDSSRSPKHGVVDAVLDATEPPDGQTTLTLYEHLDPDALDALIDASADKRSHVEVRFTIDEFLVVVRSTDTILVYEPLQTPE